MNMPQLVHLSETVPFDSMGLVLNADEEGQEAGKLIPACELMGFCLILLCKQKLGFGCGAAFFFFFFK